MASPAPDHSALLESFLLRTYMEALHDPAGSAQDQLQRRMAIEHLILEQGTGMLRVLQRAFNVIDDLNTNPQVAQWFMTFVSSLSEDWLRETSLGIPQRIWRESVDVRLRRKAADLIAKIEVAIDPYLSTAYGSSLVALFREAQPKPFDGPLAPDAKLIIDVLFERAKLMPLSLLNSPQGALGRYSLRVVRYCFADEYPKMSAEQIDTVASLAGDVNDALRGRILIALV